MVVFTYIHFFWCTGPPALASPAYLLAGHSHVDVPDIQPANGIASDQSVVYGVEGGADEGRKEHRGGGVDRPATRPTLTCAAVDRQNEYFPSKTTNLKMLL